MDGLRTDSTRWMTGPGDPQSRFRNSTAAVSENNAHRRFYWGLLPWQPHFRVSRSFLPPLFLPRALRLMEWYFSRAILGPGPWMKIQPRKYGRELRMRDLYIELRHRPPAISTHALQAASPHTNRPRKNPWGPGSTYVASVPSLCPSMPSLCPCVPPLCPLAPCPLCPLCASLCLSVPPLCPRCTP